MKHLFGGLSSLLFLIVVLAACGGSTGKSTMNGMNMGGSSTPASPLGTASGGSRTTVQVTESEYTIASSVTSFAPGTPYHFVVTNKGQTAHEFMIMPKSEGAMNGMSMHDMDKIALAMIETLAPGETKTVDFTFPSSAAGSHPELACYLPGHYEAGMKLGVTVKA